jgi:hypothetical protein
MIKKLIVSVLLIFSIYSVTVKAEENEFSMDFGTDVTTNYVWRGYKLADLSVQPEISVNYAGSNIDLSFGFWGSASLVENYYSEIDAFVSASLGNFTLSATDYGTPNTYFDKFNENHALDISAEYYFGENIPLTLKWSSIDFDSEWSHYCELNYDFSIAGFDMFAQIGFLPFSATYYTDSEDFVLNNLSLGISRELSFWNVEDLPVSMQVTYNPDVEDSFLNFSVSF